MFLGPVLHREFGTLPRRPRFYVARTLYVTTLFGLMVTALILLTGSQNVRNLGDWARFGAKVFHILAPLQLALATFLAAMITSAAVAYEKDRRTLVMLLLTDMLGAEIVLGRLLASLLEVLTMVAAALPLFMFVAMLGGVSYRQIISVELITIASVVAAGSIGSTIALWREKTFQALAMTALLLVVWFLAWEFVASGNAGELWWGVSTSRLAAAANPWSAIQVATQAFGDGASAAAGWSFVGFEFVFVAFACAVCLNLVAIARVRVWNTSTATMPRKRAVRTQADAAAPATLDGSSVHRKTTRRDTERQVWNNPVLWREIRTWAYGKKIIAIRLAYAGLAIATIFATISVVSDGSVNAVRSNSMPPAVASVVALFSVSVLLINALAVTAISNERDGQALDLLLVTDLTAKEFIFGKLAGVLFNTKEMIVLPIALCIYLWVAGKLDIFNLVYLVGGLLVMIGFSAMLGIHCGITYAGSRTAVGTSLGTIMFLLLGVATCMKMMIAFKGAYLYQLGAFTSFLIGGGIALYFALGWRNPSQAIFLASMIAPFATFFVITSFLVGQYGGSFLVAAIVYGGATTAMLIPAIAEFDVALGRTSGADGE